MSDDSEKFSLSKSDVGEDDILIGAGEDTLF